LRVFEPCAGLSCVPLLRLSDLRAKQQQQLQQRADSTRCCWRQLLPTCVADYWHMRRMWRARVYFFLLTDLGRTLDMPCWLSTVHCMVVASSTVCMPACSCLESPGCPALLAFAVAGWSLQNSYGWRAFVLRTAFRTDSDTTFLKGPCVRRVGALEQPVLAPDTGANESAALKCGYWHTECVAIWTVRILCALASAHHRRMMHACRCVVTVAAGCWCYRDMSSSCIRCRCSTVSCRFA
jgi:hypothetical protein